jgi:hypothetical protein
MKKIPLTRGKFALVDDEDYEWISQYKWTWVEVRKGYPGYAVRNIGTFKKTKHQSMHRLIMGNPKGKVVDHINGNSLDNRRSNLRIITDRQNLLRAPRKKSTNASSRYKGVVKPAGRKRWAMQVWRDGTLYRVGGFDTEHHAALARDLWAIDLHGDLVYTNFKVITRDTN